MGPWAVPNPSTVPAPWNVWGRDHVDRCKMHSMGEPAAEGRGPNKARRSNCLPGCIRNLLNEIKVELVTMYTVPWPTYFSSHLTASRACGSLQQGAWPHDRHILRSGLRSGSSATPWHAMQASTEARLMKLSAMEEQDSTTQS